MGTVEQIRFGAMGSDAHVVVVGGPVGLARDGQQHIERLEARWSRFRPSSDVARLNARAGEAVYVHPDTVTLVMTAVDAWRRTAGRYDPTVHDSLVAAGYDRTFDDVLLDAPTVAAALPAPGCGGILIDADDGVVRLPHDVHCDFGGIGKGLAADLVVEELLARGAAGALVNIGGDVRASGRAPDQDPWTIEVEDPFVTSRAAGLIALAVGGDVAVATSSILGRRWRRGGSDVHHLLDPRSGRPLDAGLVAATVIASRGWLADVATKVVLDGGSWPAGLGDELPSVVFHADGRRELRAGAHAYFHGAAANASENPCSPR